MALFCSVECVWSWLSVTRPVVRESVNIFGLVTIFAFVFTIFVTTSIAYRSSFWADRFVFGAVAVAFVFGAIKATVPLIPHAIFAVNVAKSLMWTIASSISLIVLARGFRASTRG